MYKILYIVLGSDLEDLVFQHCLNKYPDLSLPCNTVVERPEINSNEPSLSLAVDGCYARLLLLYTYRGFSTTTQGQSTCRRSRSLILERIWRKYHVLDVKL